MTSGNGMSAARAAAVAGVAAITALAVLQKVRADEFFTSVSPREGESFREANYSDTPDEPVSPMSFVDTTAVPGRTHRYQVATVNGDGLEGPRSAAVEAGVPAKSEP